MLSKLKRPGEIECDSPTKKAKTGKGPRFPSYWKFWFLSNYEYTVNSLTFANEIILHSLSESSQADRENRSQLKSLTINTIGTIIKDIWGENVKYVKRGPRKDRQTAYLNLKRVEKVHQRKSEDTGFALDDLSLPQGWKGEADSPTHFTLFRREKKEFNGQRLSLELSVELPSHPTNPSSEPVYKIKSHGCVADLGSVLNGCTATPLPQEISHILQYLDSVPICLGFVHQDEEPLATSSPHTTGQLRDLSEHTKEPENRAFSSSCLVICNSGNHCLNCGRLKTVNAQNKKRINSRLSISEKCNKGFLSREELLDQLKKEKMKRRNAEKRESYWREKFNYEALVVDDKDHVNLTS